MSNTDYKKTVVLDRSEFAWGTPPPPDDQTRMVNPEPAAAPPPVPAPDKPKRTVIIGIPGLDTGISAAPTPMSQEATDALNSPVAGWLVVVRGPGKGMSLKIGYGVNQIGSGTENRIILDFNDPGVSRLKHAQITYSAAKRSFRIAHVDGINPTAVNGEEIDAGAVVLKKGDLIQIGSTLLRFVPFCEEDFDWETAESLTLIGEKKKA
ncbi:FHA domain-containing protein [Prosthecobacter sp.]|uniref:FHA domain-containing protein n=1 Tax=Prosthecobacter sp. TaxID=1965333 RepID=UPI003784BE9B